MLLCCSYSFFGCRKEAGICPDNHKDDDGIDGQDDNDDLDDVEGSYELTVKSRRDETDSLESDYGQNNENRTLQVIEESRNRERLYENGRRTPSNEEDEKDILFLLTTDNTKT